MEQFKEMRRKYLRTFPDINDVKNKINNVKVRQLFRMLNHAGFRSWLYGMFWYGSNNDIQILKKYEKEWEK